jgi:hypothetical protein
MRQQELYLVVIAGASPGIGRVLGQVRTESCGEAIETFKAHRTVGALPRGLRIDAVPARLSPGAEIGRGWSEVKPGIWLYPVDLTTDKITSYPVQGHAATRRLTEGRYRRHGRRA